jgi:predicted molibdopterin-dependent oxidoreductase YjgC
MKKKPFTHDTSRAPLSQRSQEVADVDSENIGAMVKVEIDDFEVRVPMGTTILEAAKQVGIKIPTLCHHDDLCLAGVCRVCVVEVEGQRTLQAACSYPIFGTTKVKTYSLRSVEPVGTSSSFYSKIIMANVFHVRKTEAASFRNLAEEYGVSDYEFGHIQKPRYEIDDSSYSVVRDMDKCILCKRCVGPV